MTETKSVNLADIPQQKLKDLLEFPCSFTFKVVGAAREGLIDDVVSEVQKVVKGDYNPSLKESGKGTYHSVSITIQAENIEQVETLYTDLAKIEGVRMVL
ncbi:DUF493 family protein YbeD [Glaesserella parasuis]|uniref:UPF0250 protein HAPS_1237 n=3 Tax=Glaesserella parasuis TaxID=738 RepID=B8F681_GLAP5|nr:DUF493 family protein YbeD [Glaesserella parasuis]ACL32833.1 conserved hypothetical protein [Glaesserella parasuis SH0165]EMY46842.1 hypothetical protein OE7_02803 [Glaesserella parasuis gx033]KDB46678.1 hypothetical protein HPS9_03925 [Glaesserella parasuis HPS9]MCT8555831.1 DUF493 family protein YbeD [Glaesserella parasuis]MCT8703271.1 DUF493 family protein YbeD [Glaesserella parasuis]